MTTIVRGEDLSGSERKLLFWASFLALAAAGFGFSFRVALGGAYGDEFSLNSLQVGQIFGASLWPIAITMIGFSLVVDKTGYKLPMYAAFALQAVSGIGTFFANSYELLYFSALCAGLGHGIVEAVINPICAAVYPREKTKWLTILHAAWPAGLVGGTLMIIATQGMVDGWRFHALWIVIPALAYAIMYLKCRFPVDERVQAGVPYMDMLKQIGFLGAALAGFLLVYEIGNQVSALAGWDKPDAWFTISLVVGLVIGAGFGAFVKAIGQPLFFFLCLLMIPIATAELGTDAWIKALMTPVLETKSINPAFALVFSAFIMLMFRVFAGGVLKFFSPPTVLCISGLFSAVGLYWLAGATGVWIFIAFVVYAIGQTYYWPCILGFVSERYPQGGALTLNTVSAIGLLSVGIVGAPILGSAFDRATFDNVTENAPALAADATKEDNFLWMTYDQIDPELANTFIAALPAAEQAPMQEAFDDSGKQAGRDVLRFAAWFPGLLILAFGAITISFRMRGGYEPIHLQSVPPPAP